MKILFERQILHEQARLANMAEELNIISYGYGPSATGLIACGRQVRLILGIFNEDDERKARAYATRIRSFRSNVQAQVASCRNVHAKLFMAKVDGRYCAIVGSANLGTDNHDIAVYLDSKYAIKPLQNYFEALWKLSSVIKTLSPIELKKVLSDGGFEDRRESPSPDPSNQQPQEKPVNGTST